MSLQIRYILKHILHLIMAMCVVFLLLFCQVVPAAAAESNSNNSNNSSNNNSSDENRRVVFVGDSRTVGMYITLTGAAYSDSVNATSGNETYIGRVAMGYSWFVSTGMPEASAYLAQGNTDLVILMGCNDMGSPVSSAGQYAAYVNANVEAWSANNNRVFFDSVNPVGHNNGGSETSVSIYSNDGTCAPFNETLKASLSDKVTWIDSYDYLVSGGYATVDGIHYDSTTYHAIHDYILQKIKESEKKSYTVSFDAAGGTGSLQEKKVKEGDDLGDLPTPEREGYTFAGWYLDQTAVNEKTAMPAKDITLKAAWKASDRTPYLVVTHIKSEGNVPSDDGADSDSNGESRSESTGETVTTETRYGTTDEQVTVQMPEKEGYVTPAAQTQTIAADGSTRFDFTYYPKTYKLTVHLGRGVRLSLNGSRVLIDGTDADATDADFSLTCAYGTEVKLQATLDKGYENLQISGSADNNAGNTSFTASSTEFTMPDHDVELTLLGDPITYHISYTKGAYDTAGLPESYTVEDLPLDLKTPQMPALTSFEGWQDARGKTIQSIPAGENGDLRLTGIVADYRAVAAADLIGILFLTVVAIMSKVFPSMRKHGSSQHK